MNLVRWHTKQKPENVTRQTLSRREPTNDNGILSESCQEKGKVQNRARYEKDPETKRARRDDADRSETQIEARCRKNLVVPKRP